MFSKDPGVKKKKKERLKNDMIGIVNQDQLHHPIQSKHLAPWTWTQNIWLFEPNSTRAAQNNATTGQEPDLTKGLS